VLRLFYFPPFSLVQQPRTTVFDWYTREFNFDALIWESIIWFGPIGGADQGVSLLGLVCDQSVWFDVG
jgi:hypothetical protein